MAIDSFECRLITGGYSHCNGSWNKSGDELDKCFKIYNPVNGSAYLTIDNTEYPIQSGNVYFISGFHIESQGCNSFMDIYWLHFIPASLHLRHILLNSKPVHVWNRNDLPFMDNFNSYVQQIFRSGNLTSSNITSLPYSFEEAKIHCYIMNFIADILKGIPIETLHASGLITRLNPSIKFMNNEFRQNPPLDEIASKSNLAPNYFHRLFKKNFGLTPFDYMQKLRMEHAIKLLTTTDKTVKEIAFESGYENEFYFHRQFKKQYKYSPSMIRKLRPF